MGENTENKIRMAAMPIVQSVGKFNFEVETFESYTKRIKIIFKVNEIKPALQTLTFLSVIGPELFTLLLDLISPKDPENFTVDELISALNKHFKPKVNIVFAMFQFHERNQGPSESIVEYVASLKKLASKCEFGTNLEDSLRDKFVIGIKNRETQQHLFTVDDLTFDKAVQAAISRECAKKEVKMIANRESTTTVNKTEDKKPNSSSRPPQPCRGCGRGHWRSDCPFKNAKCHECDQIGHLKNVCRQGSSSKHQNSKPKNPGRKNFGQKNTNSGNSSQKNQVKNVQSSSSRDDTEYIFNTVGGHDPILVEVLINNKNISMELDSGSFRSLIKYDDFKKHFGYVKFSPCNAKISGLGGKVIKVVGEAQVQAKLKSHSDVKPVIFTVIEVDHPMTPLLGRRWFTSLGMTFNVEKVNANLSSRNSSSVDWENKYRDVFKDELGAFNKHKVHIELKPA